jgi:ornithine carbamoyltransferase
MKKDFLSLLDIERTELEELFELADELKINPHAKPLDGTVVSLIFQKPSLRTRVSFEIGVHQLGGYPVFLPQDSVGIGQRESAADVAGLLSRYGEMIVARVFDHNMLVELSRHADIPIVNALSDLSHPCQVLADLYTLRQHRKLRPGLKVVFVGDGNNVVNSWLEMATLYPMHFVLAAPEGYGPDTAILHYARSVGLSTIEVTSDPHRAVLGADVIYTDVWTSMGQEEESEKRRRDFADYQVDFRLLAAAQKDPVVMHCMPAHRGEEISAEVLDGPHSIVFDQAENRLHVQKALITKLLEEWRSTRSRAASGAQGRARYVEQCELSLFGP